MNKKIFDYLLNYFGGKDLQSLLDKSSRRYKISRYNDHWKYYRPKDATGYTGGIKWDPVDLMDIVNFSEGRGYLTPEQSEELHNIIKTEPNANIISYEELPNYYKDVYDSSFDLPQGPRDEETMNFLSTYGSDSDSEGFFGDAYGEPGIIEKHPNYSDNKESIVKFSKGNNKFGNKQIDPVTGDLLYNRGDLITEEALNNIKSRGIDRFSIMDSWKNSTDIERKKLAQELANKLAEDEKAGARIEDAYAAYLNERDEQPYAYIGLFDPRLEGFNLYDYNEAHERQKNIADSLEDISKFN